MIDVHLLKNLPEVPRHRFEGDGNAVVSVDPDYRDGHIWINSTQCFTNVPQEVWEFEIGAYQVCEKWLKERKETTLRDVEIRQYQQILAAIAETIHTIAELDIENNM